MSQGAHPGQIFTRTERERMSNKQGTNPGQISQDNFLRHLFFWDKKNGHNFFDTFFWDKKTGNPFSVTFFSGTPFFRDNFFSRENCFGDTLLPGQKKNGRTFSQDNFFQDTSFEKYILAFLDSRTRKELKIVVAVSKTKSCPGRKVSPFFDLE